jgi:hypothetical protein
VLQPCTGPTIVQFLQQNRRKYAVLPVCGNLCEGLLWSLYQVLKPNRRGRRVRRILRSQTDTADRDGIDRPYGRTAVSDTIISPSRPSHSFRAVSAVFARKSGQLFCNPLRLL